MAEELNWIGMLDNQKKKRSRKKDILVMTLVVEKETAIAVMTEPQETVVQETEVVNEVDETVAVTEAQEIAAVNEAQETVAVNEAP
jgi:hypothetical protein